MVEKQLNKTQVNINQLGALLDGYAELIPDMGNKTEEVRQILQHKLKQRADQEVDVQTAAVHTGSTGSESREYTLTQTDPGATVTIYIEERGPDLYVSWRTRLRPVPNTKMLLALALIAIGVGVCGGTTGFLSVIIGPNLGMMKGVLAFFSLICAVANVFGILIVELLLVGAVSYAIHNNPLALFFIQPNWFDAEDITAMSLLAHDALFSALKQVDIDTSILRSKDSFTGGRKGDVI